MAVTMNDVARAAGVSLKTVSNVLNDYEFIRPATKQRVQDAIAELGYEANLTARSLRSGKICSYPDVTRLVQDPTVEVGVDGMSEHRVTLNIGERMGGHDDVGHLTEITLLNQIPVRDVVLKELCP